MWKLPIRFALVLTVLFALGCAERAQESAPAEETQAPAAQEPAAQEPITLTATLSGAAEVPGPGDPDGSGTARVTLNPGQGQVCYEITVTNIGNAGAAHIHQGAAGASGGPVVNLDIATNGLNGCVSGVAPDVITAIRDNPSGYYLNVHTAEFGGGAVRGQLASM